MEKGLELSRKYFLETAEPKLKDAFPELYPRLAAGLCGNGSECFGYDDEVSRDHDWGPAFCIWLEANDFDAVGGLLQDRYDRIAARGFNGIAARILLILNHVQSRQFGV